MKQIVFSDSQWSLLLSALTRLRLHRYNQWKDWCDNHRGILLAGLEECRFEEFRQKHYEEYMEVANLYHFCRTNAREIEGDKA